MDKIDELKARVAQLEQEKRIAELELQVVRLEAEIATLKAQPIYMPCPYPVYPDTAHPYPWRWYDITWTTIDSSQTSTYEGHQVNLCS